MSVHSLDLQISELHSKTFSFFFAFFLFFSRRTMVCQFILAAFHVIQLIDVTSIPRHRLISKCGFS